jgi:hypothetical protein
MSTPRVNRYLVACGGDTRKALTLYRKNLRLSQELFTVVSCFEVALRNAIDEHYIPILGNDWLRAAARAGGIFGNANCRMTADAINDVVAKLYRRRNYTHDKTVAELGFGFWRYLFSPHQYRAAGQTLINIFPALPPGLPYNANFMFNELATVNKLRNRLAHHEAICFTPAAAAVKDTTYARQQHAHILQQFLWLRIDHGTLLYGLDHINIICNEIDTL